VSHFRPFAAGVARLLPGGQNDIKANDELIQQLDRNQQTYNNLFKQGKINKDQYSKLTTDNSGGYAGANKTMQDISNQSDMSQVLGSAAQIPLAIFAPGGSLVATWLLEQVLV
jgi:hypothetical protein